MGQPLNDLFVNYAAEVLADTTNGLSGPNIVKVTGNYALEHGVTVPHQTYPFQAANKKTALAENLKVFDEPLRFRIIKDLAEHPEINSMEVRISPPAITSDRYESFWTPIRQSLQESEVIPGAGESR